MLKKTLLAKNLMLAFGSTALYGGYALAQTESTELQRVEITGSAIKRIDAETAVPVTVLKLDDLKKQGVTSIEQVMTMLSSVQTQTGTSQVVGAGTGGASFANLRGVGENKTLVLLNGRRVANNAFDSSAPDLNTIPFAALERVEVLRDGASALYGTDAIGGVINFITRKNYTGGSISLGADSPQHSGGKSYNGNIGLGFGDLDTDGFNIFGFVDYQKQQRITGLQRPFNKRYPGGLSPTPFPANYYQDGDSGNPAAPDCTSSPNLISDGGTGCFITTSSFVDYIPKSEKISGMLKGTAKLGSAEIGLEYFGTKSKTDALIAPVPYGALLMNRVLPDGSLNPYYPGNPGSSVVTPNITLDPNFAYTGSRAGVLPGYITVKYRDLPNGQRQSLDINTQQRAVLSVTGAAAGWDYQAAYAYNENKVEDNLAGYSNGPVISEGVLNGVINPFGPQSAAGDALIASAALAGNLQNAKGIVNSLDGRISRELGDWLNAGRPAAIAIGTEFRHENFTQAANPDFATLVISSTGIDPNTINTGSRDVYGGYAELNVPLLSTLDVTAAVRYDKYSDFGNTTNPKFSFRYQPVQQALIRGSYSTGFRAPSLYEINAGQAYTNTSQFDDPVNCPSDTSDPPDGRNDPIPGKSRAANCQQQFQALNGGNKNLKPEKARNATFGLVIEPIKDMSLGLDFWWIFVRQQIGSLADTTVFGDPAAYASVFKRNPAGDLSTDGSLCPDPATCGYVDLRTQNLGGLNTNGIDFTGAYRLRAGGLGQFTFGVQTTYVAKYVYQDIEGGAWNQNVGVYSGAGPIFRFQQNASIGWNLGQFGAGVAAHYKSGYTDQDPTNTVPSYTTFDLFGSWAPVKELSLTFGIKNVADRDPPLSFQTQVFQAGYDPRYSDPTGRTYYLRGTYSF